MQRMDTNRLANKAVQYKSKWLQYLQMMDRNRLPKQALHYKPKVATTSTEERQNQNTQTSNKI